MLEYVFTVVKKYKIKLVFHILFWIGFIVALLGFFEQCNDNGSPFWSTVFGYPILHHGYYGFMLIIIAYLLLTFYKVKV